MRSQKLRFSAVIALLLAVFTVAASSQTGRGQRPRPNKPAKPAGPSIWHNPGRVESLDFTNGVGGAQNVPKPPFTFVEEDMEGSNPKVKVKDAAGRHWVIKWGSEVNSEVLATRLAWAAGYYVEPDYFVRSGVIQGVTKLDRAKHHVAHDGSFTDGRFELKEKHVTKLKEEDSWRWDVNPFVGTKELNGLKIMMMLTSNWDSKDARDTKRGSNTAIFKYDDTGETRYLVTDWGGSMGKWGNYFSREKWDCKGYADQNKHFIHRVKDGVVEFGYSGQHTDSIKDNISVNDVRWLAGFLGRITDSQIRAGLVASGAIPKEVECFTEAVRNRIDQLKEIARR